MARKIKFPLEMENGVEVRTLEELRENFSLDRVLTYLLNGKLVTWLRDRQMNDIADVVSGLDKDDERLDRKIFEIFDIEYNEEVKKEYKKVLKRNRKLDILKTYKLDEMYVDIVDQMAIDQKELYELLNEGKTTIYLFGEKFFIPIEKNNICYIGVNNPTIRIDSKKLIDFESKNISFKNINFEEKCQKIIEEKSEENCKRKSEFGFGSCRKLYMGKGNIVVAFDPKKNKAEVVRRLEINSVYKDLLVQENNLIYVDGLEKDTIVLDKLDSGERKVFSVKDYLLRGEEVKIEKYFLVQDGIIVVCGNNEYENWKKVIKFNENGEKQSIDWSVSASKEGVV